MANVLKLSHEKTNKGSAIQHILVNGIELSGRTVVKSDDLELYNRVIKFLDEKAQEAVKENPRFAWVNLTEWRSWANGWITEFLEKDAKVQEDLIRASIEEANKD